MMNLIDIIDEMADAETFATVIEGKKAIALGTRGFSDSRVINKPKIARRRRQTYR